MDQKRNRHRLPTDREVAVELGWVIIDGMGSLALRVLAPVFAVVALIRWLFY